MLDASKYENFPPNESALADAMRVVPDLAWCGAVDNHCNLGSLNYTAYRISSERPSFLREEEEQNSRSFVMAMSSSCRVC
jgi:hypothetical protein